MQLTLDHTWLDNLQSKGPIIIAGPCSAESEEQLIQVAHALKDQPITYLRAGIWKPRTRPNCFEGIGAPALEWMKAAKKVSGLHTIIEVAKPAHVELALKAEIDALWIGARTTANPFAVQEIAQTLRGVDIPVLIKNPINPDLSLWLGAIERFNLQGIKKLMVIHRGFSTFSSQQYRNEPMWKIPMELKRRHPHLPIICDPSHIGGTRELIAPLAQKAYDLDFNGLMIETHPHPEKALSDAKQQIPPTILKELLTQLDRRSNQYHSKEVQRKIDNFREIIDDIDFRIIEALKEREEIVKEIGILKSNSKMTAFQVDRLDQLLKMRKLLGSQLGLDEQFISEVFNSIHENSVKVQTQIMHHLQ